MNVINIDRADDHSAAAPAIGEAVKVYLPGETPWAECVGSNADGSWLGRVDNHLVCTEKHGVWYNDVIRFVPLADAPRCPWQAAHLVQS